MLEAEPQKTRRSSRRETG